MTAAATPQAETFAARRAMLEQLYRDFNARDIDAVMEHLAPEVDWPNAKTGGRVHGRAAVREYWQKQWKETDPTVEPMRMEPGAVGTTRVRVDQLIKSLDGEILSNTQVEHVYEFQGPFISRMTIVDVEPDDDDDEDE